MLTDLSSMPVSGSSFGLLIVFYLKLNKKKAQQYIYMDNSSLKKDKFYYFLKNKVYKMNVNVLEWMILKFYVILMKSILNMR